MVDLLGLGLFVLGLALVVVELAVPGYYIGVAASIGTALGLLQMVWPGFLTSPESAWIASLVAAVAALLSYQFYRRLAPAVGMPSPSPPGEVVGRPGIVVEAVRPHTVVGRVEVDGTRWPADADAALENGAQVIVERIIGTHLLVARRARRPEESEPARKSPSEGPWSAAPPKSGDQ